MQRRYSGMSYNPYNPNPRGRRTNDCVVRMLCKVTNRPWRENYVDLASKGLSMYDMPSSNPVWGNYLRDLGYKKYNLPDNCPDCYTINDFCLDNRNGIFVLSTGNHVVYVENGEYFDAFDSGDEVPTAYWMRERF